MGRNAMSMARPVRIDVRQLRPGLFVSLAERWMDHPFLFNEFRLASDKQIATIRAMGLTHIDYYPERSTAQPLPLPATPPPAPQPVVPTPEELAALEEKRLRVERIRVQREQLARCERVYTRVAGEVKSLMTNLFARSTEVHAQAQALVDDIVGMLMAQQDVMLHLMNEASADENTYFHALNVMILSLLLGKAAGLPEEPMKALGLGALFHDLGKAKVPDAILRKDPRARSKHEEAFYRLHTEYGAQMAKEVNILPPPAVHIVRHHHETLDGSGFPDGLAERQIPLLTRIVAIANRYDDLCNQPEADKSLSPAEALAHMYRKEGAKWDATLVQLFIKNLGVYPPGSVVQLSNGAVGLVMAFDRTDSLRPSVLLYDPAIPKREALIVDLREAPEVKIEKVLRPGELAPEVSDYLAPRKRLSYFYDGDKPPV